jgi:hypothetical protein
MYVLTANACAFGISDHDAQVSSAETVVAIHNIGHGYNGGTVRTACIRNLRDKKMKFVLLNLAQIED